eukprot:INCI17579.1.p1 GENE.INCI17579.1~~INCI17579.1.p1  ORF type:complete len:257 (-),score=41.81 INCI17579.1:1320-2090(-)
MDHSALQHGVARLTAQQLNDLCASKSGKHWEAVLAVFRDSGVDGDILSDYVRSPDDLHSFLEHDLNLRTPKVMAKQLLKLLTRSVGGGTSPRPSLSAREIEEEKNTNDDDDDDDDRLHGRDDTNSAGWVHHNAAPPAREAKPRNAGHGGGGGGGGGGQKVQSRVSVRIQFTPSHGRGPKRVTVDTASMAPPRTVVRSLLDHLELPLSTTIILSHAGKRLDGDQDVDWVALSVVHAVQLSDDTLLSLENLLTHPARL